TYVRVETARRDMLDASVNFALKVSGGNAVRLGDRIRAAVAARPGGDLRELQALAMVHEIIRSQPKEVGVGLARTEVGLAAILEKKLLILPKKERIARVLAYADVAPGNPLRQFEAYARLKELFTHHDTILLAEALKDQAVEQLKDRMSTIADGQLRAQF